MSVRTHAGESAPEEAVRRRHEPAPVRARAEVFPRAGEALEPGTFLTLQRFVGNRAVARALSQDAASSHELSVQRDSAANLAGTRHLAVQRDPQTKRSGEQVVPDPSPPMGPIHLVESVDQGGVQSYAAVMAALAAAVYSNPLHKELVRHYVYAEGRPFALGQEQMGQVLHVGSPKLDLLAGDFTAISSRARSLSQGLPPVSDPSGATTANAEVSDRAVIGCDSDLPSLGNFSVYVQGTLTATRDEATSLITYEFTGTMRWYDLWDFDPHVKAQTAEQLARASEQKRTESGEWGVRQAHSFLPGVPFAVESPTVAVTQRTGYPAQW